MWLVYFAASDSDQPVHTWSQAIESEAKSEEKGNALILAIPIPLRLRLQFRLLFFNLHCGTKRSIRFRFRRQCEPALSNSWARKTSVSYKITDIVSGYEWLSCKGRPGVYSEQADNSSLDSRPSCSKERMSSSSGQVAIRHIKCIGSST